MVILSGKVQIKNKIYEINGKVKDIDKSCEYFGLIGQILEIRTGDDKETENDGDDIIVKFHPPTDKEEIKKLEETFSNLYKQKKTLGDIILDYVVMDAESLISI